MHRFCNPSIHLNDRKCLEMVVPRMKQVWVGSRTRKLCDTAC